MDLFGAVSGATASGGLTGAAAFSANMSSTFSSQTGGLANGATSGLSGLNTTLGTGIAPIKAAADSSTQTLLTNLQTSLSSATNSMSSSVSSTASSITSHVTDQISNLPQHMSTVKQALDIDNGNAAAAASGANLFGAKHFAAAPTSICDQIAAFFGTMISGAKNFFAAVTNQINAISAKITALINLGVGAAASAIQTAVNAVNAAISIATAAVTAAVNTVTTAITNEVNALASAAAKVFDHAFARNLGALFGHPCTQGLINSNVAAPGSFSAVTNPAVPMPSDTSDLALNVAITRSMTASLAPPIGSRTGSSSPVSSAGTNFAFAFLGTAPVTFPLASEAYGVLVDWTDSSQGTSGSEKLLLRFTAEQESVLSSLTNEVSIGPHVAYQMMDYMRFAIQASSVLNGACWSIRGTPKSFGSVTDTSQLRDLVTVLVPKSSTFQINTITIVSEQSAKLATGIRIRSNVTDLQGTLIDFNYVKNKIHAGVNPAGLDF